MSKKKKRQKKNGNYEIVEKIIVATAILEFLTAIIQFFNELHE